VEQYKKFLVQEYISAANQLQEEYLISMKKIENFEKKSEILIQNLLNQAKLAVFQKPYEDRTEGEDIVFSKGNLEFFQKQLKLELSFDWKSIQSRIKGIFDIEDRDYFSVFSSTLHSFIAGSSEVLDFTPNFLTRRLRKLSENVKWNKGNWIGITDNQVIQNNVEVEGSTGLALITNYNQVKIIEKISYVNESGFLAYFNQHLFYLGSENAFKFNLFTLQKSQLPKVPFLVKEESSESFESKLVLASQNQPSLLLFDPEKNEYIKKKCDPLKQGKKFLFKFHGKLLLLYENFLYEVLDLGTCKLYILSEALPKRWFKITSYKIIEKHVYLLTNDRVVYRLSMISKSLDVITLDF
jgi:hypothetical protein